MNEFGKRLLFLLAGAAIVSFLIGGTLFLMHIGLGVRYAVLPPIAIIVALFYVSNWIMFRD